jgi:hypothetical protein
MTKPSILDQIEASSYDPSDDKLRELIQLAASVYKVDTEVTGSYFRVLNTRALRHPLPDVHKAMYTIVKEECITPGMTALERNSATNFARSAYSTLAKAKRLGFVSTPFDTKGVVTQWIRNNSRTAVITINNGLSDVIDKLQRGITLHLYDKETVIATLQKELV